MRVGKTPKIEIMSDDMISPDHTVDSTTDSSAIQRLALQLAVIITAEPELDSPLAAKRPVKLARAPAVAVHLPVSLAIQKKKNPGKKKHVRKRW